MTDRPAHVPGPSTLIWHGSTADSSLRGGLGRPVSGWYRCTLLCSALLYCTVLYCTVPYCTVLCCTLLYSTLVRSGLVWSGLVRSAPLCSALLCSALRHFGMRGACWDGPLEQPPGMVWLVDLHCVIGRHRCFFCLLSMADAWCMSSGNVGCLYRVRLSGSSSSCKRHGICQGMSWQHLYQPYEAG